MGRAHTYRFLVVDDDAINRHLMMTLLKNFNAEVDLAANGEQALLALSDKDYDVVFMDVHMPVMGGIEAMVALRTALPDDSIPTVVALTGSSDNKTLERCLEAGMTDYLTKPTDMGRLRLWLQQWEESRGLDKDDEQLLNLTRIRELKELEGSASTEAVVAELITMFRNECPIQIANLKTALQRQDHAEIEQISHKLKGSLLNLGLHAAADICARLERFAHDDDVAPYLALIDTLEDLYTRSYAEFSQYLRSA